MPELEFVLRFDPGPFPLAPGMELSVLEVVWGLRLGGFNPGSVLYDQVEGSLHTVRQDEARQYLDPPSERLKAVFRTAKTIQGDGSKEGRKQCT